MAKLTLDEMLDDVKAREAITEEAQETTEMIYNATEKLIDAAVSGKVTILSDYDADGICSAYILEHTVKAIAPECDVDVQLNDRRGSYGLSPDLQGEDDRHYIISDMGSNQLPFAREQLGDDVIIIDHHLIEDDAIRNAFVDNTDNNKGLLNPHALHENDEMNAQYCATGLAYRVFQEMPALAQNKSIQPQITEKLENTMAVMAAIGTATDMVDVLDTHSNNREILKDGLRRIDNADEKNLDFVIGNMLARNNIPDGVTAHQLAFNVGAFLNSASRMSEIAGENGAARMYKAITGDELSAKTYRELDFLQEQNTQRKALIGELTTSDEYKAFVQEQRYGNDKDNNIAVYQLPDNVPHAFAGLVAGKLAEATDKAILCVTYEDKTQSYSGSGRNTANNETSLKAFVDSIVAREAEAFGDQQLQMTYGGHSDAIGISALNDITRLEQLVDKFQDDMKQKPLEDRTYLDMKLSDISSQETLAKVMALEPTGTGLQLPSVVVEGKENNRNQLYKRQRPDWKSVRIVDDETKEKFDIADWAYDEKSYPQFEGNRIALVAELGISDYKGIHVELTAKTDRAFSAELEKTHFQEKNHSTPEKSTSSER